MGPACLCNGIAFGDFDDGSATMVSDVPDIAEYGPSWSPDGSRIAFHRAWDIVVRAADGAGETILPDQLFNTPLAWSPDGAWLYGLSRDGRSMGIVDPDGHAPARTIEAERNAGSLFSWQRLAP